MKKESANNYTLETMDSRDSIPFRRSNRYIAGSINGALLLEQIIYWFGKMGNKPFYKLKEPCDSPQYKPGQSWCEELGFSSREFDTSIKLIGQKISKNIIRDENALVHYWVDFRRLTFYEINMDLYIKLKNEYYEQELIRLNSIDNEQSRKCGKRSYDDRKCGKRSYVNAESAFSVNAESASGSIIEYLSENTNVCVVNPEIEKPPHTQLPTLNSNCIKAFETKFDGYDITIEDLFHRCSEHYEGKKITVAKFIQWIKREHIINHAKISVNAQNKKEAFDRDRHEIIQTYAKALKENRIDFYFPNIGKRKLAENIYNDHRKILNKEKQCKES